MWFFRAGDYNILQTIFFLVFVFAHTLTILSVFEIRFIFFGFAVKCIFTKINTYHSSTVDGKVVPPIIKLKPQLPRLIHNYLNR